jgi:hypothetical protein
VTSDDQGAIGLVQPAEWREHPGSSARRVTQLTNAQGNSYPLYYFVPSISSDNRYLIFHSERSGWVQLYRLDLKSGEIVQLTDGRTDNSGWAIWDEWHLRGVYVHLSALNTTNNEVYYFNADHICCVDIVTCETRHVAPLPCGRMPIGQASFSPDGTRFAFIHVDRDRYTAALREREALTAMGLFNWGLGPGDDHERFRNSVGDVALGTIVTASGEYDEVISRDFHFHHVLFGDNRTLIVNHPKNHTGIWAVDVDGRNLREIRPPETAGAHGAQIVHNVVTERGIFYEAVVWGEASYLGRYDLATDQFDEAQLLLAGYLHTGFDPAGRLLFVESMAAAHDLRVVRRGSTPDLLDTEVIYTLQSPGAAGQRHHAHPFLSPDREWMYFTDQAENGFKQIFRVSVEDLADETSVF